MIRVLLVDDQALVRSGIRIILDSEPDIEVVGEAENGELAVTAAGSLAPDVICMDVEMPVLGGIEATRRILSPASHTGAAPAVLSASAPAPASASAPASAPAVLMLTTFGHDEYLFDALAAGASGFLLKTSRAAHLIDAVRVLAGGGSLLGPEVTGAVLARVRGGEADRAAAASPAALIAQTGERKGPGQIGQTGMTGERASSTRDARLEEAYDAAGLTARERSVLGLLAKGSTNAEIALALFLGEATVKTHVSNVLQKLGVRDRLQAVVWVHTRE